jgi:twitching motility two-component system response regulator PilH
MGKILIADDSLVEIKILEKILKASGHRIVVARNGEEAEKTAKVVRPDLIFLDVVMPKKNGFQVCRDLRLDPLFKTTPIVLLTSKSQDSDKFWGKQQGATEYVTKPYQAEQILEILTKYL